MNEWIDINDSQWQMDDRQRGKLITEVNKWESIYNNMRTLYQEMITWADV